MMCGTEFSRYIPSANDFREIFSDIIDIKRNMVYNIYSMNLPANRQFSLSKEKEVILPSQPRRIDTSALTVPYGETGNQALCKDTVI